jgi:hypothetical protein
MIADVMKCTGCFPGNDTVTHELARRALIKAILIGLPYALRLHIRWLLMTLWQGSNAAALERIWIPAVSTQQCTIDQACAL